MSVSPSAKLRRIVQPPSGSFSRQQQMMRDSRIPIRSVDKRSTIYLSQNAFSQESIKNKILDSEQQTVEDIIPSYKQLPKISTPMSTKFTPTRTTSVFCPQSIDESPISVKKPIRGDPMNQQRKQTIFAPARNQNVYHLYTLLRKQKSIPEEPKLYQRFEKILKNRKNQFKKFVSSTKTRGQTFLKFAFKSHEQVENKYIEQYMQEIATSSLNTMGSMTVADLWSNKQLLKFLKSSKLNNDKIMFQKLNKIMIKDRKDADQKELIQAKLLFSVFKDDSKNADHPEHLGKNIYLPKKRYQKQILGRKLQGQSNEKIQELVNRIDEIHDDNLYLYQSMTNVLDKMQVKRK